MRVISRGAAYAAASIPDASARHDAQPVRYAAPTNTDLEVIDALIVRQSV